MKPEKVQRSCRCRCRALSNLTEDILARCCCRCLVESVEADDAQRGCLCNCRLQLQLQKEIRQCSWCDQHNGCTTVATRHPSHRTLTSNSAGCHQHSNGHHHLQGNQNKGLKACQVRATRATRAMPTKTAQGIAGTRNAANREANNRKANAAGRSRAESTTTVQYTREPSFMPPDDNRRCGHQKDIRIEDRQIWNGPNTDQGFEGKLRSGVHH